VHNFLLPASAGANRLTAWPEKVYIKDVERVNLFHPEALEKGIETPTNPGPFVLPAAA